MKYYGNMKKIYIYKPYKLTLFSRGTSGKILFSWCLLYISQRKSRKSI